jgi:hypothetical protein
MSKWLGPSLISIAALAAAVALIFHGEDVPTVAAILAAVGIFLDSRFRIADQNETLGRIDENVNGKLDARIKASVKASVAEVLQEMNPANNKDV